MLEIAEKLSDTALANQPLTGLLISSLLFLLKQIKAAGELLTISIVLENSI
jgi:hypothetical protein